MIDRRLFIHFDWTMLGVVLILSLIGILNLYSTSVNEEIAGTPVYLKQVIWLLIGLTLMGGIAFVEYRRFADFAFIIYSAPSFFFWWLFYGIALKAQRWVRVGSLSFQPSEFVKISLILALAKYFQKPPSREGYSLRDLLIPFLLLIIPMVLILKQPNLGTAIILLLVFTSVLFFVKIRWSSLIILALSGAAIVPLFWNVLKDYQKRRIINFFNPDLDPLGAGYHHIQSKIAVGSGGILGKGFMEGTQSKLGFLPEQQTDFIFSALGEEWGLIGSFIVMGLYFFLILWGLRIAVQSKDRFGAILAFGIVAMLFASISEWYWPDARRRPPLLLVTVARFPLHLIGMGLLNVSMRRYLFNAEFECGFGIKFKILT
jgi:rod shape determining protein RodA